MTDSCTLYNIKLNGTDGGYCSNNAVGHQTTSYNGLLQNHTNFFVLHSIVISSSLNAVTYHTITTNIETQFETTATHNHRIGQNTFIPSSALSIQANITCNFVTAWEGNSIITLVQALINFKLRLLNETHIYISLSVIIDYRKKDVKLLTFSIIYRSPAP